MSLINHAVIMAAGRGRRMKPLTDSIPKPMAPYLKSTLIATGVAKLRSHVQHIHVTVGYKGAMLAQHLIEHGVDSIFNTDGQSNSWWVYNTLLMHLDRPVLVLTCDNVMDLDVNLLEDDYQSLGNPAGMLVPVRPVPGLEGDYIFREDSYVTRLSRTDVSDIYCSGIQVINPYQVNRLTSEGLDFYSVWKQLMAQRQLLVSSIYPKNWFTVDTVADLEKAHQVAFA